MAVEVHLPTVLRPHAGGNRTIEANGATIGEVIADAVRQFPSLEGQLAQDGQLRRHVNVYRNDEDVRYLDKLDTKVTDKDVISVLPAVAGG